MTILNNSQNGHPHTYTSSGEQKMNHTQESTTKNNDKSFIHRNQHTCHGIFSKEKLDGIFRSERFCWRCHTLLRRRKLKDGTFGLFCYKCSRFRKLRLPVEARGGGWCRTDVRMSGKLKRKVSLDSKS